MYFWKLPIDTCKSRSYIYYFTYNLEKQDLIVKYELILK